MLVNLSTQESKMALRSDKQWNLNTKATLKNKCKDLYIYDIYNIYH